MSGSAKLKTYLLLAAFSLMMVSSAMSRTIYVDDNGPADFNNIQAAIDDSNDGDTIIVVEGEYMIEESICFGGKKITLKSEMGAKRTEIRLKYRPDIKHPDDLKAPEECKAVVVFSKGETQDAVLEGFTITGGKARWHGGISCVGSSPIIRKNIITKNVGSAIGILWSYPRIIENIISDNIGYRGGAIGLDEAGAFIKNNIIINNSATGPAGGGGIGFFDSHYSLLLLDNIIAGNTAQRGGGIGSDNNGNILIKGNTITKNSSEGGNGGGVCSTQVTIVNSIIWGNEGSVGYEDIWGVELSNIYYSLTSNAQFCNQNGNICEDPRFVDSENIDYHLQLGSPCIDAGDPNYVLEPNETDLDGKPRVIGGRIDMGAYEYSPPVQAEVRIVPRTVNLQSKGKWINAFLWLPEGYDVVDIDSNSLLLEDEIEPQWVWFDEEEQVAMVMFSREEVQGILDAGQAELTITGRLTDGTVFEAKDVIIVINKGSRKSAM